MTTPLPTDSHEGLYQTLDTLSASHRYNAWLFHTLKPFLAGQVLDIGSGLGDIVAFYAQCPVERIYASDRSPAMVRSLKERFSQNPRYSVLSLDITRPLTTQSIPVSHMDTLTCVNVLEHIPKEAEALACMRALLKPQGTLLIVVPAFPFLYGTLDALVGHQRRYTQKTLKTLLSKAGLRVENLFYLNLFGTVTWFMAGRVFKHKRFPQKTCGWLDRLVPALEHMENTWHPPFGQSLIAVARNPNEVKGRETPPA